MGEPSGPAARQLRPTSVLPFASWALLLVLQLVSPDKVWSWLLVALSFLIGIAYGWACMLRDQVNATRRTLGTWVVVGDQIREQFTLINGGLLPVLWARVHDRSDAPGYHVDRVETASPGDRRTWHTFGMCQRRGVFHLGPWDLEMGDPLGFFRVMHRYGESATIVVYPRASHLPAIELPRGRAPGRSTSSDRALEDTMLVGGSRDYAPGDPLRRVQWKASARHDRLIVHEFDREPSGDLWLILDLHATVQAGQEAESTVEYGIILTASLAAQFLRQGERRAVGLATSGRAPIVIPPARGQAQMWTILEALALAEPSSDVPLADLLRQAGPILGTGRSLVILTPSQDPAWVASLLPLMAAGNAPTALLLDATTFDPPAGSAGAMMGLRGLLAQQRVPSTVLSQGYPFRPIDKIRRQRTEWRMLSGSGRVIRVEVEEEV